MPEPTLMQPFYVSGNFAPVDREISTGPLEVDGAIPSELDGVYMRIGPNPLNPDEKRHWFSRDGMVHGMALSGGKAAWYRNRYVQTADLALERAGVPQGPDHRPNRANTSILSHAGRVFALVENAFPTEITAELGTVGEYDFAGRLKTTFTAHPLICPDSGEMHAFGYSPRAPLCTYHQIDAAGVLQHSTVIDVKGATMMHGFALTTVNAIFMDLPVVFDAALMTSPVAFPYRWSDDYGARLGLVRRDEPDAPPRWVDVDPCYVFHPVNAYEDGAETVIDVARYDEMWRGGPKAESFERAQLHRWRIGANGQVTEQRLDERSIEFPRVDPRVAGRKHRYSYAVRTDDAGGGISSNKLIKYDDASGSGVEYSFPEGALLSEFEFIPASATAGEDEGWLIGFFYSKDRNTSALAIIDAQQIAKGPIATVWLPQRVPQGFHGSWVPSKGLNVPPIVQ